MRGLTPADCRWPSVQVIFAAGFLLQAVHGASAQTATDGAEEIGQLKAQLSSQQVQIDQLRAQLAAQTTLVEGMLRAAANAPVGPASAARGAATNASRDTGARAADATPESLRALNTRHTFFRDPAYGAIQLMFQYSHLSRSPWFVAACQPADASLNMLYVNLRYSLPGAPPPAAK